MQSTSESSSSRGRRENDRSAPSFLNHFLSTETRTRTSVVPRRKHQKSRRGCTTCKRRHIRCDEASPRCQNCVKHRSTCSYPDASYEAGSSIESANVDERSLSVQNDAASSVGEVEAYIESLEAMGPANEDSNSEPDQKETSPRNLDLGFGAIIPITAAQKEQIAFCE